MKRSLFLSLFLILTLCTVSTYAASQLCGNSLVNSSSLGIWADSWDYAQRGEEVSGRFKQNTLMFGLTDYNYLRIGYAKPGFTLTGMFDMYLSDTPDWNDKEYVNTVATATTTTSNFKDYKDDSLNALCAGFGFGK